MMGDPNPQKVFFPRLTLFDFFLFDFMFELFPLVEIPQFLNHLTINDYSFSV